MHELAIVVEQNLDWLAVPFRALPLHLLHQRSGAPECEIDGRARVVGIFPKTAALLPVTTALLVEQDDEWQDGRPHFSQQSTAQHLKHGSNDIVSLRAKQRASRPRGVLPGRQVVGLVHDDMRARYARVPW